MTDQPAATLSTKYGFDTIDGRQVPRLVVTGPHPLIGLHQGSVHVEGGTLTLVGVLQGSLDVQSGASVAIFGTLQGSVSISKGGVVSVTGSIQGSAHVAAGGRLTIEASGKLAGSLHNNGHVIIRGVFGGPVSGKGELVVEATGRVKKPTIRDGVSYYEW